MNDTLSKNCEKLKAAGVCPSSRVAVCSENSPRFAALTVGCWKLGATIVPLSLRFSANQLEQAIQSFSCEMVFVSRVLADIGIGKTKLIIEDVLGDDADLPQALRFDECELDPNADASIILTSGSTGAPKGVLHTIANHYYSAAGSCDNISFTEGHCWAASLPMYHISGFSLIMRSLIGGGSIYYPKPGESLAQTVMQKNVTHISLVSTQLKELMEKPECIERLRKYKAILVGGSAIPPAIIEKALAAALPIYTTYGSSETASQLFTAGPEDLKTNPNTSGRLLKYRKAKPAPDGEILAGGKTLFKGYVSADGITSAAVDDGWFHTGDIGRIDENGLLFVTGRKDRMFISGGENIYPEEIEKAIEGIDGVERAVVEQIDDERFGKRPAAFVKMRNNKPLKPEHIRQELRKTLEGFKIPEIFPLDNLS